jgi:mono/diheme cytochrome c family protein
MGKRGIDRSAEPFVVSAWGVSVIGLLAGLLAFSACEKSPSPGSAPSGTVASSASKAPGVEEQPAAIAGWIATFTGGGREVKALWPSPSFMCGPGQSPDPAIPAAGFAASFTGDVAIDQAGRYRFTLESVGGTGALTVYDKGANTLGLAGGGPGKPTQTDWLDLPATPITVSVKFARSDDVPARVRVTWQKEGSGDRGFVPEPIPPSVVSVASFARRDAAAAVQALHGRVLLAEFGCNHCHARGGGAGHEGHAGDPVLLNRPAPNLGEVGRRVSPAWLHRWIADPPSVKPGTPMPRLFTDSPKDKADAEAVVHFLVSLGGPVKWESAAAEPAGLARGRRLYHTVGCVACHGPIESPDEVFGSATASATAWEKPSAPIPLGDLAGKWRPSALAEFLKDPLSVRPAGRMPSMNLTREEADFIATYLASRWNAGSGDDPGALAVDPAKAEAGKAVFAARGCAACHEMGGNLPPITSTLASKPFSEVASGKGCMDPKDAGTPRFGLTEADRKALAAGIEAVRRASTVASNAPIDAAHRTIEAFGCRNCHERDGSGGPSDMLKVYFRTLDEADLGDEGRLPPRLTGEGWKLATPWIHEVLTNAGRARPYMATRMPQFGESHVGSLADALAQAEGVVPGTDRTEPQATDERVAAGRRLVGDKGMNCISCHTFGGKAPAGTPGPNIVEFAARIRYEWFKAYIMDPQRFKPGTKMTAFYHTLDGMGTIKDVFGGDPEQQTDALWAYFTLGRSAPEPEGLPAAPDRGGLSIKVGDRPVVFRTFLKDAGSRGIAVGYPSGLHFAFDAERARLVDAWRGDFLDASGAWKGRGGQITGGRGGIVWTAPKGPVVLVSAPPGGPPSGAERDVPRRFKGYAIDARGVPTFRYAIADAGVEVEERFEPARGGMAVLRTFTVHGVPDGGTVWLNAGPGVRTSTSIVGVAVEQHATVGDAAWIGYTAAAGKAEVSFSVEVEP